MTEPMTPERLEEIRQRCEAAQAGPWHADVRESWDMVVWGQPNPSKAGSYDEDDDGTRIVMNIGEDIARIGSVCGSDADCHFIAATRTDIPDLLSHIERQAQEIERLTALLREGQREPIAYCQPADMEALRRAREHGDAVTVPVWWAPEGSRPREVYTIPLHAPEGAKEG